MAVEEEEGSGGYVSYTHPYQTYPLISRTLKPLCLNHFLGKTNQTTTPSFSQFLSSAYPIYSPQSTTNNFLLANLSVCFSRYLVHRSFSLYTDVLYCLYTIIPLTGDSSRPSHSHSHNQHCTLLIFIAH